jgi:tetratricopeptide (TPR) repeat protein
MDCRWKVCLLAGLLVGLCGCTNNKLPVLPEPPGTDPARSAERSEPPKALTPATLVALAALREQMAEELAKSPEQRQQLLDDARRAYLHALKLDPNCLAAHRGLARHWENTGQHEKAMTCYDQALKLAPRDASLWHEAGMCQARHKEWTPALERLRKAIEADRENRQYVLNYALCLARAESYDEALAWLMKLHPPALAHFTLARMMHHNGRPELSRQHLQAALQANPGLHAAQQMLVELEQPASQGVAPQQND